MLRTCEIGLQREGHACSAHGSACCLHWIGDIGRCHAFAVKVGYEEDCMEMAHPSLGLLAMMSIAWVNVGMVAGARVLVECLPM